MYANVFLYLNRLKFGGFHLDASQRLANVKHEPGEIYQGKREQRGAKLPEVGVCVRPIVPVVHSACSNTEYSADMSLMSGNSNFHPLYIDDRPQPA